MYFLFTGFFYNDFTVFTNKSLCILFFHQISHYHI
jgi:hypothetical protein